LSANDQEDKLLNFSQVHSWRTKKSSVTRTHKSESVVTYSTGSFGHANQFAYLYKTM